MANKMRICSPLRRLPATAPNWAPMVEPLSRIKASKRSTVWFTMACWRVTLAEVSTIWKRSVPMAAMVGMPMI